MESNDSPKIPDGGRHQKSLASLPASEKWTLPSSFPWFSLLILTSLWNLKKQHVIQFIHFITSFGKFGPPYLCKTTSATRAALPSSTSVCWVFLCFCNLPNSSIDYRIFIVRKWSVSCVCIHIGVGHTDNESAQHFWLGKAHKFFLCSWRGSNLRFLDIESDTTNWAIPVAHWIWWPSLSFQEVERIWAFPSA